MSWQHYPPPVCPDCEQAYDPFARHDCAEARAKCLNGDHDWLDITQMGDLERRMICGRVGSRCVAEQREPFPPVWTGPDPA